MNMALALTAWKRPHYLARTLESWHAADGVSELARVVVGVGRSDAYLDQLQLIREFRDRLSHAPVDILADSTAATSSPGMHRALGELGDAVFNPVFGPAPEFVVFGEEDVIVSSDVLRYMAWASLRFASESRVLAVCAHSVGGQGWDAHEPASDQDADQETARLRPYFNAWVWGTWRDRWNDVLAKTWDWECDSGGELDSGYDWNIATRVLPSIDGLCVVPDASRSQNIGRDDGVYCTAESFAYSRAASFMLRRDGVDYRLTDGRVVHVRPWANGMVMAFDALGEQVPAYQGLREDVEARIRADFPDARWEPVADWQTGQPVI